MIVVKELLPNPLGDDLNGEWIRLTNTEDVPTTLQGLLLKDESNKIFNLKNIGPIAGGETIELKRSVTGIALNNDGDTVYLSDESGKTIDELSYASSVSEEEVIRAQRFTPEAPPREPISGSAMGLSNINYSEGAVPLAVALVVALACSLIVWFVIKNVLNNEGQ